MEGVCGVCKCQGSGKPEGVGESLLFLSGGAAFAEARNPNCTELTVYFCSGTDKEKLDWFRVINIAGERQLNQELLNAVSVGPFVAGERAGAVGGERIAPYKKTTKV